MRAARLARFGAAILGTTLACSRPPAGGSESVRTRASPPESTAVDSTYMRPGAMGRGAMGQGMMRGRGGGMMRGGMMGQGDTSAAPRPRPATAAATAECPAVDAALVDGGRRVFTGPGNCQTCHGADARGTGLAPDLTDATWLNIDGSYAAIAGLVRQGVPHPRQYPGAMPAMGGAALTAHQVCAVAAYVYSLGH